MRKAEAPWYQRNIYPFPPRCYILLFVDLLIDTLFVLPLHCLTKFNSLLITHLHLQCIFVCEFCVFFRVPIRVLIRRLSVRSKTKKGILSQLFIRSKIWKAQLSRKVQKTQVIRKVKVWPPRYRPSLKVSSTLFRRAAPNFRPSNSFYIGITTKLELSTLPTDKKKTLAKFSKLGQTW